MAVMLTSRERVSRTELTLTENISDRGARVVTKQVWSPNDSLVIKSLEGDLQSEARVIYPNMILISKLTHGHQIEVCRRMSEGLSTELTICPQASPNFLGKR